MICRLLRLEFFEVEVSTMLQLLSSLIKTHDLVQVGALVITSGGSQSLAPRGIVVGRVIKIVERTGTSGAVLEVRLTAKLTALNFVRVLLYQPVATGIP
jgi:cell shape-determining protein MreC